MKKYNFLKNRYVHLLCISIFFILPLNSQFSEAKELRDSVESLDTFPAISIALPIYEKIYNLSRKEADNNNALYSKIYISHFHSLLGNNIEAAEAAEEAYELAQDTTELKPENIIFTYQLLQQLERKKGNLIQANEWMKKSVKLELENGLDNIQIGLSYLEIATGNRILGDFENAITYSNTAFKLFENTPDSLFSKTKDKNLRLFRSLQIRGLVNKDIQLYDNAIDDYMISLEYLQRSKQFNEKEGVLSRIDCFARMTDAYLLKNDLLNASNTLKKLEYLVKSEPYNRFRYYELSAVLALKQKKLSRASINIQKAIEFANDELKNSKEFPEIARLNMIYGDYFVASDFLNQAIEKYHKGLQYFDSNLVENISTNPNISSISEGVQSLKLLEKKAETFLKLYNQSGKNSHLINGISTFNTALDLIDKMKSDFINEGSKYRVAELASSIFPKALEANYSLYQIEKNENSLNAIFNIIEKNKAEILFQNISSKYNLLASSLPKELIKKGIDLKYNISYYSKLLSEESQKEESDKTNSTKYKDKLFKMNEALSFYDQNIKEKYPEFHKFKNEIGKQISINELQYALEDYQLIIEYFQTENHLYTVSISKETAEVSKTPIENIKSNITNYFKLISTPPTQGDNNIGEFNKLSQILHTQLILQSKNYSPSINKLILVPDGLLNRIPFESLVIDQSGKMLIEASNISYNYSASQFLENHGSPMLEDPGILCLTPTFDGYTTSQRTCNASMLGDLPNTKREFDYLKSNFSGSFSEGDSANITILKDNFAKFPIIHLATHACLNDEDPMLSQIYFSDGALTTYDIQNLNSRPELVVLSACNTATGQIKDGEGVIGLSRGFFEAGVKGLQSSLWSIDDFSSSVIVNRMYHHLKNGKSKSEALRLSKLDYLKDSDKLRSHPYYWAALIHIGNDTPMQFSNSNQLYLILLLFAMGLGIIGFYFYKKRS